MNRSENKSLRDHESIYFPPETNHHRTAQDTRQTNSDSDTDPFIFKYFFIVEQGIARCSICYSEKGLRIDYSVKNSCFKNAQRHLDKYHNIVDHNSVTKRQKRQHLLNRFRSNKKYKAKGKIQKRISKCNQDKKLKKQYSRSRYSGYIFRYFTRVDEQHIRCNMCELVGKVILYSIKKSLFKNADAHLEREHSIFPEEKDLKTLPSDVQSYCYQPSEPQKQIPQEGTRKCKMKDIVFQYFTQMDEQNVRCNLCDQLHKESVFSVKHSIYKNVRNHLMIEHNVIIEKTHKKPHKFYKDKSIKNGQRQLIDLICRQGISLYTIDCNSFFKDVFKTMNMYKSESAAKTILKEFKSHKLKITAKLNLMKANGQKFSLSLAEVNIASRNWILVCLNCQQQGFTCLGLIKLSQKITLSQIQTEISKKIYEYQIHFSDIISIVGNSPLTSKIGNCFNKPQLFCLQKDIELFLLKQIYNSQQIHQQLLMSDQQKFDIQYIDQIMLEFPQEDRRQFRDQSIAKIINKIRRSVFTMYRIIKSNNYPENDQFLSPQKIHLDSPFKWRSLLRFLKHYYQRDGKIFPTIQKLDSRFLLSNREKIELLQFYKILSSVQTYLNKIAKPKSTILTANENLQQIAQNFDRFQSPLGQQTHAYVTKTIQKLDRSEFTLILNYLKDHKSALTYEQYQKIKDLFKKICNDYKPPGTTQVPSPSLQQNQVNQLDFGSDIDLSISELEQEQNSIREQAETHHPTLTSLAPQIEHQAPVDQLEASSKSEKQSLSQRIQKILNQYQKSGTKNEDIKLVEKRLTCIPLTFCEIYKNFQNASRIVHLQPGKLTKEAVQCLIVLTFNMSKKWDELPQTSK